MNSNSTEYMAKKPGIFKMPGFFFACFQPVRYALSFTDASFATFTHT